MIYKILSKIDWTTAIQNGSYEGSKDDVRDGFIHFSTGAQLAETAKKHFSGQDGLLLVAFNEKDLGPALKWEPSRGGALFPHLYDRLDPALALWSKSIPLASDGTPNLPAEAQQ
ncbi:MAG: DUF952 domain-containing protein [Hyphomicrobiaceae bacterium]